MKSPAGGAAPERSASLRKTLASGICLALVFIGLSLWIHRVNADLPCIADETVYLWQAEHLASLRITDEPPRFAASVGSPFIPVSGAKRFGQYPIGYPLALAPWVLAGIPWALNVTLACVSLALLFRLARRLDDELVAWTACGLTAVSPFFLALSTVYLSHALALTLCLLTLVFLEAREREPRRGFSLFAAGCATAATLHITPFLTVALMAVALERAFAWRGSRPVSWREGIAFLIPLGASAALFAGVDLLTTGHALIPPYFLSGDASSVRPGFGEHVGGKGYHALDALQNTAARIALLDRFLLGWPIPAFVAILLYPITLILAGRVGSGGTADAADRSRHPRAPAISTRWTAPLLVLFVATIAVYTLWYFHGTAETLGPRYFYPAIPAAMIFAARGLVGGGRLLGKLFVRSGRPESRGSPFGVAAVLAAALVLTLAGTVPMFRELGNMPLSRWRRATRGFLDEVAERRLGRATIFVQSDNEFTLVSALLYVSRFGDTAPLVFARDLGDSVNARLVEARGDGPVLYARARAHHTDWVLSEDPMPPRGPNPPR